METTHEHSELEQELRALRPRAMAPESRQRIEAACREATTTPEMGNVVRPWCDRARVLQRIAAALFIGVSGLVVWSVTRPGAGSGPATASRDPASDAFEMVAADTTVVAKRQHAAAVMAEDGEPVEGVEYELVDRVEWQRAKGSERFIMERPRREVIFTAAPCY
jgi:hypothetical protein